MQVHLDINPTIHVRMTMAVVTAFGFVTTKAYDGIPFAGSQNKSSPLPFDFQTRSLDVFTNTRVRACVVSACVRASLCTFCCV